MSDAGVESGGGRITSECHGPQLHRGCLRRMVQPVPEDVGLLTSCCKERLECLPT